MVDQKQLLDEYTNSLLAELGLPDNTDEAIINEMKSDILERFNNLSIIRALESLPAEKMEELNKIVGEGGSGGEAWNYVQQHIDNFDLFSVNVMKEFRDKYLGK